MNTILYPLILVTVGAGTATEKDIKRPEGPQPLASIARMSGKDELLIWQMDWVPVNQEVQKNIIKDGVTRTVTENVTVYQQVYRMLSVTSRGMQGYDTKGKKIDAETVRRRLKKDTSVLISTNGQPVDRFYLNLFREGTLILVVPSYNTLVRNEARPRRSLKDPDVVIKLPKERIKNPKEADRNP
jgi:hypothetical protein